MALPLSAALQSNYNQKYLSYKRDQGEAYKHLQFTGNEIVSEVTTTRFALERSTSNRELIHVRCCYSNRYWVRNNSTDLWIVASAEEPQEDTSLPSCTLFRPVFVQNDGTNNVVLRLLHVQSGFYASLRSISGALDNGLYATTTTPDSVNSRDVFTLVDWDSLVIFPKRFILKGDNGKYLTKKEITNPHTREVFQCLESSSDDPGESGLRHEAVFNPDGTVRIRNLNIEPGFWTFLAGSICLEGGFPPVYEPAVTALNKAFRAIKVADNAVSFLSQLFHTFCNREPSNNLVNCLAHSMTREARFEVEEALVSRQVYNVTFRLENSRIYDETPKTMASATGENRTSQTQTRTLTLSYKKSVTRRWEHSMSFSLGFTISFSTGVPLIVQKSIEITGQFNGGYTWGEEQSEEEEFTDSNEFPIPPMNKTTWTMLATEGTCDVPFSYTVRDVYTDGQTRIYEMHDGLFRGVNSYNFYTTTREEPLS